MARRKPRRPLHRLAGSLASRVRPLNLTDMPDRRAHRGQHPQDADLFAARWHPILKTATAELAWLLSRNYATPSALKLVGDRHRLDARQRMAVQRSTCTDSGRTMLAAGTFEPSSTTTIE